MDTQTIVEMKHICKSFYGIRALDDVSFDLRKGEVMALLGENGAGKSTLVKIMSGVYTRDSGEMKLFGRNIEGDLTPKEAQELGITIIHQELNMCRHLTVAQNIFLGRELCKGRLLDEREMNRRTRKVLEALKIDDITPDTVVGDLQVSKQQMVEIAKAFETKSRVLIMDEPTSALTNKEIEKLFDIINELKKQGVGIVYISHRLEELKDIVDRVTIMRDGRFITECNFKDITMDEIIKNMVGREIREKFPRVTMQRGGKIFSVRHLSSGRMVKDVSFDAYKGEILGIAGLMGAGRTETTRAIFGADRKDGGVIELEGNKVKINCPRDAIRQGIVLAPEDRKKDGLCTKLSVRHNISLPNLDILCRKTGTVNKKKENGMLNDAVKRLSIKLANGDVNAASLSGGNQQKLVVAKWLSRDSKVVIFDEPTRGIDVGAKIEIYNLMNKLKKEGKGVIFVSSELPEILGIADRILVMCDGRITGELAAENATQENILYYATRFEDKKIMKDGE
ncbi:MAG TPA: D-xylose ABC transporter ATP-binding protein [Treponema sp.]|nr:D-xylose ABC transporter ATP-binding protein [Treponema sp.]